MQIVTNFKQGDDEWFSARCGSIGGSSIKAVMTGGKGKTRMSLMYQLAGERITGQKYEFKATQAMEEGRRRESESRDTFSFITGLEIQEVALIKSNIKYLHCSPDGLTSDGYGLELKNPMVHTHVKYVDENRLPPEYVLQVQYSMWITDYEYWYFFSYFPGIKPLLLKVKRDEAKIKEIESATMVFLKELDELVEKMR